VLNRRGIWFAALTVCALLAILFCGVFVIPHLLYPPLSAADLRGVASGQTRVQLQRAQSQLANNGRSAVLQGLAGLVIVIGAVATWWQVHISREGQITDRFTKAVDQLGSPNIGVRIGGIYALERIAKNSAATGTPPCSSSAPLCAPTRPGRSARRTARSTPPRPWTSTCPG
jgi:hypothetical protein